MLGNIESLAVRKKDNIKSIADLKGKTIAVPFATTSHYCLLRYLNSQGMSESDVKLLDMDTNSAYAAWKRGDIDAAWVWQPALQSILDDGGEILVSNGDAAKEGYMTANVEVVSSDFAEKHPELVQPCEPGAFWYDPWPQGYQSPMLEEMATTNPDITSAFLDTECLPKLATCFLESSHPGVVMTYAETRFLLAEAKQNGWNVSGTVEEYYNEGVRASMNLLSDHYGCDPVTDDEFNTFIQNNGVGQADADIRRNINTQAWMLHFLNPNEAWANQRRSGYPELKSPAEYGFSTVLTGGQDIPVRLCYPRMESSYNSANFNEAVERMGGTDSWNNHVWWDVD